MATGESQRIAKRSRRHSLCNEQPELAIPCCWYVQLILFHALARPDSQA